jgi:predicted transposase/invertase (TIGR01784 family)
MFSKFLDPKNDVAFKKIFGSEKNKDILIHFLNDMVAFPGNGQIRDVTFLKTIQDPETAAQKTSLVDILCQDEKGHNYIVEMQVAKDKGFAKRAQYYASKVYSSQLQVGQEFHDLKEVIFLAIVDFEMFPNKKAYKSDHVILDKESHEHDLKDFSFTFLELPKFAKNIEHLCNVTEKWAYFFKHASETSEDELKKLIGNDPIIERAYEELNRLRWNKVELLTYDQADLQERVYRGALEQKFDEGFGEGFDKGQIKREEEIVSGLIKQGIEDSVICLVTRIPLEKLRLLRERITNKTT